ncbi:hypothetical protein J437_LFUL008802 [Ladona fulva]|uniref:Uncharacterized protein n=1 Tax=Ladona fulva TaxID=123851 RepID=A0A8K0P3N9_LADFU|nr:hypothetical protein J437_LFUL008802 [Ladona fulva]
MAVPRKSTPAESPSEASLHPPAKRHRGCSSPNPSVITNMENPASVATASPTTPPLALTARTDEPEESVQVTPCGSIEAGVAEEILKDAEGETSHTLPGAASDSLCGGDDEEEDYGDEDQPLAHLSLKMEPPEFDCGGDSNSLPLALTLTLPNSSEEVNIPTMLAKVRRASECRLDSTQIKAATGQDEYVESAVNISNQMEVTPVAHCSLNPATSFPCPFCERSYTSWGFRRRHEL